MSWASYFAKGFGETKTGSTYIKDNKMLTNKQMQEAMDFIAGTCMTSPEQALQTILGKDPDAVDTAMLQVFLEDKGCYECNYCGWFTHPGETCDCEEECFECSECHKIQEECTCE